jgi:hypothetical protein
MEILSGSLEVAMTTKQFTFIAGTPVAFHEMEMYGFVFVC